MYKLLLLCSLVQSQELNLLTWPSTVFSPPYAGVSSVVPNIDLTNFVGNYSSARLFGTISVGQVTEMITFTLQVWPEILK